nr:MAG TPA: hypothetical protein [Inoviridae sp.]
MHIDKYKKQLPEIQNRQLPKIRKLYKEFAKYIT